MDRFLIEIKDKIINWKSEHQKKLFARYVAQFNDGEYYISIEKRKNKRSDQQNNYYWMYLGIISEDTGHTTEELHSLFKGMFISTVTNVLGKPTRVSKSTTKLSKVEFVEYIMRIEAETGIPAPDTQEYLGYSYHK